MMNLLPFFEILPANSDYFYRDGMKIVEFCAGSGSVALVLAHLYPSCAFVILDMKQPSLDIGILGILYIKIKV